MKRSTFWIHSAPLLFGICLMNSASASMLDITQGLNLWLRADSVTTSGATVDTWIDLTSTGSGIGDNLSQDAALTDGAPSLVGGAVNSRPSVNFGGGGGYTYTGPLGISGTQAFTVFTVVKNESNSAANADERVLQFGDITDNNLNRNVALDVNVPGFRYNNGNRLFNEDFPKNTFSAGMWTRAAGTTYGQADLFIDTAATTQASSGTPNGVASLVDEGYTLGRGTVSSGGAAGNFLIGEVAEVLMFDRQLSQFEIDSVEYYIRHRYSLDYQAVEIPGLTSLSANVSAAPVVSSTLEGAQESNVDAMIFLEAADLTLSTGVDVNIQGPGSYATNFDNVVGQVAAGQRVNSYFLSLDTIGQTTVDTYDFVFENPILGIIAGNTTLADANAILGNAGTLYMTDNAGMEQNTEDLIVLSGDGKSLSVTLRVGSGFVDQLRIITAAVPEPGSLGLVLLGAGLLFGRLRASARS